MPMMGCARLLVLTNDCASNDHQKQLGFPSNREGFPYAAAGWSAASLSYWMGDINAAEVCRRRLL
jgi:hypothetical protein